MNDDDDDQEAIFSSLVGHLIEIIYIEEFSKNIIILL